ncbi:hypothetical protein OG897_31105 [Streptomyces sp. NBC_00237]|nr:hypothetical protein [Streptomyces sp. NBC_00237]MCX5205866.1 hypothetical protein [Streptomyces sp. NBC_00237]
MQSRNRPRDPGLSGAVQKPAQRGAVLRSQRPRWPARPQAIRQPSDLTLLETVDSGSDRDRMALQHARDLSNGPALIEETKALGALPRVLGQIAAGRQHAQATALLVGQHDSEDVRHGIPPQHA